MKSAVGKPLVKSDASLRGKTTLVTGASRGIGKAIATLFAHHGAQSIFVVRQRESGEKIVEGLKSSGLKADVAVCDVTQLAQIKTLVFDLMQRYKQIDVLVNNAGLLLDDDRAMRPSQIDAHVFQETIETNLIGPMNLCSAFIPHIANGGRIINLSSGLGQFEGEPEAFAPAYSISKAGLNMYTQKLAVDLQQKRIMVDSMDPGWVKTDMGGSGATTEPEQAAETALFLATREHSSSQTGLFWRCSQVIPW
jgi:NAD(P)-dependent dehydrogenase (short-subunit alcohol dehydrogenase family)